MRRAESLIALGLMALAAYFMWHATVLPIGWTEGAGPGGGAFPFWLSALMLVSSGVVFARSVLAGGAQTLFFKSETFRSVVLVVVALSVTVAVMPWVGAYVALAAFMVWYLRFFGEQGWGLTVILTVSTLVFLFFFFEVTLKILLPKGWTEPLFIPLYAIFF
ncbi:tripartite tricarboxylate transporter TctB family protein [Hoeflea sp.]|uniref:tripartite tricarboxylate transporter TctB family protein n=1 Tax=Hoeflea sp. TaxID=1940281 RepID=UPI00374831E8